jgi:hypothetical protein
MSNPTDAELEALAAGMIDAEDERALSLIAGLYSRLDPVPGGLVDRINFGITLDAVNAEIAELQRSGELAGVRSDNAAEVQNVTFTSASLTLMITISPVSADRARVDGWVAPGGGVTVELRSADGTLTQLADSNGRFVFDHAPRGLTQFLVRSPGSDPRPPVVTPSIEI